MKGRRGKGEGSIRLRSDGNSRSIMGKSRAEVAKKLAEALRDLDRGVSAPKDGRLTVGAFLDNWLVTKKPEVEHSYWVRCEAYIRLYVKPAIGRVPLVKLNAKQLSTLYAERVAAGAAANTVRHLHATIHTALEDALRLDLIARNVADLVRPPKAPHLDMKTYTPEQASQLLEAASGDRLGALYVLMLTSACRLGELLGLRWTALDSRRSRAWRDAHYGGDERCARPSLVGQAEDAAFASDDSTDTPSGRVAEASQDQAG